MVAGVSSGRARPVPAYLALLTVLTTAASLARAQATETTDEAFLAPSLGLCTITQFPQTPPAPVTLDEDQVLLEAGSGSLTLTGETLLEDGVTAARGGLRIDADRGRFSRDDGLLQLDGNIRYQGNGASVDSDKALVSYPEGKVKFEDAEFRLGNGAARGAAGLLSINRDGLLDLDDVNYTTCPPDEDEWLVSARSITLDTQSGFGQAKGLKLKFKGVPILYTPYLSFPISSQRKSGFLLPNIGQSGLNGLDISVPWYWNIAPAYDATFTPRILSRRGVMLDSLFRYLTPSSRGEMQIAHLPNDDLAGLNRTLLRWNNQTNLGERWRAFIDFTDISDGEYLEDLGGSLSSASVTHLDRTVGLAYQGPYWQARLRATNFQTIDNAIASDQVPYRVLPGLTVQGENTRLPGGLVARLDGAYERFERNVGTTGNRLHLAPEISWPLRRGGIYAEPSVSWSLTQYRLDNDGSGSDREQSRSLPIFSFDSGLQLERELGNGGFLQTLEPRLFYVHIPFRDQTDLPVFDTIAPVTSIEQLFRRNRFLGIDRIGDTDQLTLGLTSRLLERASGRTLLTATIGQTRFLSSQAVTLPGEPAPEGESSDYIAELAINVWGNWNVDFSQQWSTERNETTKSEIRLQYLPGKNRVVNVAYRYRRDAIDQGDVSFSWPLASRWNVVGRYNYSFREETSLERFVGLEYESCCWGIRVVSRRYISRRDGTADNAIAIQLELKGLTSVGDPADKLLENGILGYRSTID